jgi:hypothetical protein
VDEATAELGERAWRQAFFTELVRLERLVAFHACGMTSRPPAWRVAQEILYAHDRPTFPTARKFTGTGVALECVAWSGWLSEVLGVHRVEDGRRVVVPLAEIREAYPPPGPRDMGFVAVWPGLAVGPDRRANRRRGRARRS